MFREKIPARQLGAWLFAAVVPVGVQIMGGGSWLGTTCAAVLAYLLACLLWRSPREVTKWESVLLLIYVVILTGELLYPAVQSWPMGNGAPAVPLILLGLAAVSAGKGPSAAARVGAVLFWAVLVLYLTVFAAGGKDVRLNWLMPRWDIPDLLGVTVLLIPCGAAKLLIERGTPGKHGLLMVLFVSAGVLLTVGVMSPDLAVRIPNAFYEMSRSLDLLGVARRFEALICAGTTVGWFALIDLLLSLCGSYGQKIFPGRGKEVVWLCTTGAASWNLCGLHIMPIFLLVMGTVFWVVIPLLTQGLGKIKKS